MAQVATVPPTERRSPRSLRIDRMETLELVTLINDEDSRVPDAVRAILPELAGVVDRAAERIRRGGRIHYFGAGSSGRFGVLDAAEVPPTYGVSPDVVTAHLAGGGRAMLAAVEDAEDSEAAGDSEARAAIGPDDIVVGLAASGRTPYVRAALAAAREIGAFAVAITSNPNATIAADADVHLCVDTGEEVITGSTRMKAGTAQKLVLHTFSTALMVRLGRTFSNLMIDVVPSNAKLRRRVVRLLQQASGAGETEADAALIASDGDTKKALLMLLAGIDAPAAEEELAETGRDVRAAVALRATTRASAPGTSWLGIDVGASGFRIAVADGRGAQELERGSDRPVIGGDGIRTDTLLPGISAALSRLRSSGRAGDVDAVVIGLAGAGFFDGGLRPFGREIAELTGARSVALVADVIPSYVGALGLRPGAVLAAGTGAVALGTDLGTGLRRVDGLGHLLGDLGSGAWIGRRALEAALAPRAGRPLSSPALAAALEERFGGVEELVRDLYGAGDRSAVLASFVPAVLDAASDDAVAAAIVEEAAGHLAATLEAAAAGIDGPRAAVGGLVSPGSGIRRLLSERVDLAEARSSAAEGAAEIARALRDGSLPSVLASELVALEA